MPVYAAAELGTPQQLQNSIAAHEGAITERFLDDWTLLHVAADSGNAGGLQQLLAAKSDLEARSSCGYTPLHLAAQRGREEIVQILHAADADINITCASGSTPLHLAATTGQQAVIKYLLEARANARAVDRMGQQPRDVASDIETSRLFGPAAGKGYGRTVLGGATLLHNGRSDAVRRLLAPGQHGRTAAVASQPRPSTPPKMTPAGKIVRPNEPFVNVRKAVAPPAHLGPQLFKVKGILGKGSFGAVYLVSHRETGEEFAMKVLAKKRVLDKSLARYVQTEKSVLSYIRHPFIISLRFAFQTPSTLVLGLEYGPGGSLARLISKWGRIPNSLSRVWTAQIALALQHLHERLIFHRDMKPENVVLDALGNAMLTDFGLSKESKSNMASSFCGSPVYLAPEMVGRSGHGHTLDLWGLGVFAYEMIVGMPPFLGKDKDTVFQKIRKEPPRMSSHMRPEAADFIKSILCKEPAERLGAKTPVLSHEWLCDLKEEELLRKDKQLLDAAALFGNPVKPMDRSPFEDDPSMMSLGQRVEGWEFADEGTVSPDARGFLEALKARSERVVETD